MHVIPLGLSVLHPPTIHTPSKLGHLDVGFCRRWNAVASFGYLLLGALGRAPNRMICLFPNLNEAPFEIIGQG